MLWFPENTPTSQNPRKGYGSEAAEQLLHPALQAIFQNIRPLPEDILELGCGDGVSTKVIRKSFPSARIIALDKDAEALTTWHGHGFSQAEAHCRDIDSPLPVPDSSLGLVASIQVLMWLETASLKRTLSNISKTLKIGGAFVATVVHPSWTEITRPVLGERLNDGSQPYGASWHGKKLVHWWRSEQAYIDALAEAGIAVTSHNVKIPTNPPNHWHPRYTSRPDANLYLVLHGTKIS